MNMNVHNGIANSIWNIADDVLKAVCVGAKYSTGLTN